MRTLSTFLITILLAVPSAAENLSLLASRNLGGDVGRILGVGKVSSAVRGGGGQSLLVDLGGALSPSENAFTHRRESSLTVDLMNDAGYAAWFLSGRDLLWAEQLTRFLRRTDFPVLAANLHRAETGRHLFQVQPYTVLRVGGRRIGLLGLAEPAAGAFTADPVEAARYYASLIRPRSDLVIAASAAGPETDVAIAGVEGVDVVVGVDAEGRVAQVDGGWLVSTDETGILWGIDLTLTDGRVTEVVANQIDVPDADRARVNEAMLGWTAEVEGEPVSLATVIGVSEGGFQAALTSPLGYLVADLMRGAASTDGALTRSNHFPDDFVTGDVTVHDLFRAYPLPFTVGVVNLKGAHLLELLALSDGELMYYPSGINVVYGTSEDGPGPVAATIGGKPIDPRVDYTIAVEHGASRRGPLGAARVRDTGMKVRDLLGRHLRTAGPVKGVVDGRVQRR